MNYFTPTVKLIGITNPLILKGDGTTLTPEEFVVYVARVSNPSNQTNTATAPKLIRYLLDHGHVSPLEHTYLSFEIETTRDISRQLIRHRSLTFQEYSGRYAEMSDECAYREPRKQDLRNRQNSLELGDTPEDRFFRESWEVFTNQVWEESLATYKWALKNGAAKEQARAFLPEGLTRTTLMATGNLRSWIHYLGSRCDVSSQREHRMVADRIKTVVVEHFPNVAEALGW